MTKRENAVEMIEASVTEAATKQHERNFWTLHVWRDGSVSWFEAVDESEDIIDRDAEHFGAVPSVITVGTNSFACNCDYCNEVYDAAAEQLAKDDGRAYDRSTKFGTRDEAIAESVRNSDLADLETSMLRKLERIPHGYFDDEMTRDEAIEWAREFQDDDNIDSGQLMQAFRALCGREPNAQESEALWSHVCAELPD